LNLDLRIEPGDIVYAYSASSGAQRHFEDLLRGTRDPQAGYIALGGQDLKTVASMDVRQEIMILDRSNVLDSSIRYYLTMSACKPDPDLMWAIRLVGLESTILELPDVLDTKLASSGWPLTATESMQLKLACALLAEPQIVVLARSTTLCPQSAEGCASGFQRRQYDCDSFQPYYRAGGWRQVPVYRAKLDSYFSIVGRTYKAKFQCHSPQNH
jgi:ABC-type transport system involved in cytochrome bd biosynthesis fused ATPase/permease subunit